MNEMQTEQLENLIEFVHSAVESEQADGPAPFSEETEKRLALVYAKLRELIIAQGAA